MEHFRTALGVSSGLLVILSYLTYIRSIMKGETRPDRGAYIVWGITSSIAFFAYWAGGAQDSVWFAAGDFTLGIIMVVLSIIYGYGWTNKRHIPALCVAGVGLVLWAVTDEPWLALLCSILVDAVGYVLVAVKSYEAPATENFNSWLLYLAAGFLALLSIDDWNLLVLSYPVYSMVASLFVLGAIILGRKHSKPEHPKKLIGRVPGGHHGNTNHKVK